MMYDGHYRNSIGQSRGGQKAEQGSRAEMPEGADGWIMHASKERKKNNINKKD